MFFQIDLRMNFVKEVVETICAMVKVVALLVMVIPPLIGILIMGI